MGLPAHLCGGPSLHRWCAFCAASRSYEMHRCAIQSRPGPRPYHRNFRPRCPGAVAGPGRSVARCPPTPCMLAIAGAAATRGASSGRGMRRNGRVWSRRRQSKYLWPEAVQAAPPKACCQRPTVGVRRANREVRRGSRGRSDDSGVMVRIGDQAEQAVHRSARATISITLGKSLAFPECPHRCDLRKDQHPSEDL